MADSDLKKQGGEWFKQLRLKAGLTQVDIMKACGFDGTTFVSNIENGRSPIPSGVSPALARAVGTNPKEFALNCLKFYRPNLYKMISV